MFFLLDVVWEAQSIATLMAGILAFVAAFATIVVNLILKYKEKINQYAITISKERALWISETRELVSSLCAFCKAHGEKLEHDEDIYVFEKLRSALLLRISPEEYIEKWKDNAGKRNKKYDKHLIRRENLDLDNYKADEELNKILGDSYSVIYGKVDYIRIIFSYICKGEWDRVRSEAGEDRFVRKAINRNVREIGGAANKEGLNAVINENKNSDK